MVNLLKSVSVPFCMTLVFMTPIVYAGWLIYDFAPDKLGFMLVLLMYPIYSVFTTFRKRVETQSMIDSLLIVIGVGTLTLTLAFLTQSNLYAPDLLALWLQFLLVYLVTTGLTKVGIRKLNLEVGKQVPDFVFDDTDSNPVTRRQIGEGPILFYFFRGNWCPFCSVQIAELMKNYKAIMEQGVSLAFVSTQPHKEMKELAQKFDLRCHYLVDHEFKFAKKHNLIDRGAVPLMMRKFGTDTLLPTLLLLDKNNKVLMLEQTDNVRVRPEPEYVLTKILELGANAYLEEKVEERTKELAKEKEKSEQIILNILPEHTAIELKEKGKTEARYYESATLLFSDFVGFTSIASKVEPQILVDSLNSYFGEYDKIIGEMGLEKIKTIGDAYMVAAGLPVRDKDHALKCCEFALEMIRITELINQSNAGKGLCSFQCRIGIHTGPVMAGVVGKKKFCYDIWGDTVNLAARMESTGEAGKINISEATYQLIKNHAEVENRGLISVKNHADQAMYFLNRLNLN